MTVRVNKQPFNLREKLSELERPIGVKGNELMRAETAQDARDLVSAGRKNLIINGNMRVAQRGTTTVSVGSGAASGYQIHDRWRINAPNLDSLTADYSHQGGDSSIGFRDSARFTCTAAETNIGTGERFSFETRIEARDTVFLGWGSSKAKPITVSFWVKSNLPGKYGVHVRHHDPGNAYVFPYTINQSDVWEYKTYTVPGDPYGTTNDDTGIGFWLRFMLVSGDVASSADEKWSTTDSGPNNTPGAVAWGSSTGHTWEITGVQVEAGKNATDFEHRPYHEELALCQRYYWEIGSYANNNWAPVALVIAYNGTRAFGSIPIPVTMRRHPDVTFSSLNVYSSGSAIDVTNIFRYSQTNRDQEYNGLAFEVNTASGMSGGTVYRLHVKNVSGTSGYIRLNAEL
jgi:hypothetical protein